MDSNSSVAELAESKRPPNHLLLIADLRAHLPPPDDHHQVLFIACRQRLKRKASPFLSTPSQSPPSTSDPLSCELLFTPHGTILPPSQQSSQQLTEKCRHPSRETFLIKPLPTPPSGLPHLHQWFGLRWNPGPRCRFGSPH